MQKVKILAVLFLSLCLIPTLAYCLPADGTVASGTATISSANKTTNVNQNTDKVIINWKSFNIATGETVNFRQPSASSVALNRIGDANASTIYGALNANGRIFLINPNGILFGPGSQVNVGGLLASTLNISDKDFLAGNYNFSGTSSASVVNQGRINAPGGYVTLLGSTVENAGFIVADLGSVALASGQAATVSLDSKGLISAVIVTSPTTKNKAKKDSAVKNAGTIQANGGKVILTAGVLNAVFKNAINNTGIIEANTLNNSNGVIELTTAGNINLAGTVKTTNLILGNKDNQPSDVTLTAKTAIGNLTIDTKGTVYANTDLNLSGNFIQNSGIFKSDPLKYKFNVAKNFTLFGGIFYRYTGSGTKDDPCYIYDVYGLQAMKDHLDWEYVLANDIDASVTHYWNPRSTQPAYLGFEPIGGGKCAADIFDGSLDGRNYTISGLYINRPFEKYVGLFGLTNVNSTISNVGLLNMDITGGLIGGATGGLVAINNGSIANSYSTGVVSTNANCIGGLVGANIGTLVNSYSTSTILGGINSYNVGGLVGYNGPSNVASDGFSITNCYSTGNVFGGGQIGGLVGSNKGSITNSYSTGSVWAGSDDNTNTGGLVGYNIGLISTSYSTGDVNVPGGHACYGGLVGQNFGLGSITDSYSTSNVSVGNNSSSVGGLVGYNNSSITNSYSTGRVLAGNNSSAIGGLVGCNFDLGSITNSYSAGDVTGNSSGNNIGPMLGSNSGTFTNSYYAGTAINSGGGGVNNLGTQAYIYQLWDPTFDVYIANSPYWDISSTLGHIWAMQQGWSSSAYPMFQFRYSTNITDAYQLQLVFLDTFATYTLSNNINASEAQSWNWNGSGYSGFSPIGNLLLPFSGAFNGNSNTISNLYINRPFSDYVGLFGEIDNNAEINNVGIVNSNVTGNYIVGGLAGHNNGSISNSYYTGNVFASDSQYDNFIGGLVGYNAGIISNSYSAGSVSGNVSDIGGLVGMNSINNGVIINSHYDIDTVLINGSHILTPYGLYDAQYNDWFNHGKTLNVDQYFSHDPLGYYLINNLTDLKNILGFSDNAGYKFKLTADIDLGTSPGFYIPSFSAQEFDGNGKTISNLYLNLPNSLLGFIGIIKSNYSTVGNLGIVNAQITGGSASNFIGALAGWNYGTISSSFNAGEVSGSAGNIGGLVGWNVGSILNSYNTGSVSGGGCTGGLVGTNQGSILNSYNTGSVSGSGEVGGLVGLNQQGIISNSYNVGSVIAEEFYVGGVVGYLESGSVSNCGWWTGCGPLYAIGEPIGNVTYNETDKYVFTYSSHNIYALWDFTNVWGIIEGSSYPYLLWQGGPPTPIITPITAGGVLTASQLTSPDSSTAKKKTTNIKS